MSSALAQLAARFVVDGVSFRAAPDGSGSPLIDIGTEQCTATVSVYGGHVVAWAPKSSGAPLPRPVLFCSPRTAWGGGKAIRGGVPICWPWFGARRDDPRPDGRASPAHGFARTRPWFVERIDVADNGRVEVVLLLVSDDDTLALWPHAFEARLHASFGTTLSLALDVKNVDDTAFEMEGALHTYLHVGDVGAIRVGGLGGTRFFDKVTGETSTSMRAPLTLSGETDRVYLGTKQAVVVDDPVLARTIRVEKGGSTATVVWNPGVEKATTMLDLGGDAWRSFVCIEAANVAPQTVHLSPGASHRLTTKLAVTTSRGQ